jgi:hypothetical protein
MGTARQRRYFEQPTHHNRRFSTKMAKKDYTAAEAVKLYIGNLEFDAIRIIETGEYRMSQSQMLRAVNRVS